MTHLSTSAGDRPLARDVPARPLLIAEAMSVSVLSPGTTISRDVARGAILGLFGGLLAAGAMSLAHRVLSDLDRRAEAPTPKPEDPTIKVARVATRLAGYELTERQKPRAGAAVHYAFGAVVGALYGAAAEIVPMVTTAFGLPFGTAVWLGAHVVAVPAMGLAEPPTRQPIGTEAEEFGLHLVYGSVTEFVRRLLRRAREQAVARNSSCSDMWGL